MKWKLMTLYLTIITPIVVLIYDGIAIVNGGTEASISHLVIIMSHRYPLIPFLCGVLCGHLWWRMASTEETRQTIDKKIGNG